MFDGHLTPIRVTLDVIGEIEQFILASRPDPMDMVRDVAILSVVSEDAYAAVHNEAVALAIDGNHVKPDEFQEFIKTREGVAFVVWVNIRGSFLVSFEDVSQAVAKWDAREFANAVEQIAQAGGFDRLGSLDWYASDDDGKPYERTNWRLLMRDAFENFGVMPSEF